MSNSDEESETSRVLTGLHHWLFDLPQLESHARDGGEAAAFPSCNLGDFDNFEIVCNILQIANEICSPDDITPQSPTSLAEAWACIHDLLGAIGFTCDESNCNSKEFKCQLLSALLRHAISNKCEKQEYFVGRILRMEKEVQFQIHDIITGGSQQSGGGDDETMNTIDCSMLLNESVNDVSVDVEYVEESLGDAKRERSFVDIADKETCISEDLPETKRHRSLGNDSIPDDTNAATQQLKNELNELRKAKMDLENAFKVTRERETELASEVDQLKSIHRSEMLRLEAKYLDENTQCESKHTKEKSELQAELEELKEFKQKCLDLQEENARLKDEIDVAEGSKQKLSQTEEHLRKCKAKIEEMGDVRHALEQEQKAHSDLLTTKIQLDNELAALKPLKRQLQECLERAENAEFELADCQDELRRFKEKSIGLEGDNEELQRRALRRQAEAVELQKRLQDEGSGDKGGASVGDGMSELNPELMEELRTLRSEHARLTEFASKREDDAVQRLEEKYEDSKRMTEKYKQQYLHKKSELEDTQQLLRESEAREAKLREDVEDWSKRVTALEKKMKDEKVESQKAALNAERDFQNQKRALSNKARQDLKDLEDKFTLKIESERNNHRAKLTKLEEERKVIEKSSSERISSLREESSVALRSSKELAQKRIDELEKNKQEEIEKLKKEQADEIESLTTKGKGMLRELKKKADEKKRQLEEDYEEKIENLEETVEQIKSFQEQYEKKATEKISKRDLKIQVLEQSNREILKEKDEVEDKIRKAERTMKEISTENDRLRRQLGSRSGSGGSYKAQMDELRVAYEAILKENRMLKSRVKDSFVVDKSLPENVAENDQTRATSTISQSALSQYREEYEERIDSLEQQKRELIMRNSAAMANTDKAEHRAWELEEELNKIKSENTTLKLSLERMERNAENSTLSTRKIIHGRRNDEFNKENSTPNTHHRTTATTGVTTPCELGTKKSSGFTPISVKTNSQRKHASTLPTLMDYTSKSYQEKSEKSPECTQS